MKEDTEFNDVIYSDNYIKNQEDTLHYLYHDFNCKFIIKFPEIAFLVIRVYDREMDN